LPAPAHTLPHLPPALPLRNRRYPPLESRGALTPSEISLIWDYAAKTAVRSIKYGCGMTTLGFTETSAPGGPLNTQLSWKPDAPFGTSGVSPSASFSDGGVWL
jgi:hypothetical protein